MAESNGSGNDTSLKQIIQRMIPDSDELMQGVVISASPLKIQMVNDEKLIINERVTIVPWQLTDYTTTATFSLDKGSINAVTEGDGTHTHPGCGVGGGHNGGTHTHHLVTYKLTKGTITIYNALKVGDRVHVLSLNHGKLYYVLDRVVV